MVTIDEIIRMVGLALSGEGTNAAPACPDIGVWCGSELSITIDCIIEAVNNALYGCGPAPTPIPVCLQPGDPCIFNGDCCNGSCITPDGIAFECALGNPGPTPTPVPCSPVGSPCDANLQCCTGYCDSLDGVTFVCRYVTPAPTPARTPPGCWPSGHPCETNYGCCSGACLSFDGITLQCQ